MIQNNSFRLNPESTVDRIVQEINKLDRSRNVLISIDGRSGTGKSTIAQMVAEKISGVVVVGDDFYSGGNDDKWENCTPQEKADQVIDWKKLKFEILIPLKNNQVASWHPLDFEPGKGWVGWKKELITVHPNKVIILEGAYCSRPELQDMIDLSILIEADDEQRRARLLTREGETYIAKWHQLWDASEDFYFSQVRPKKVFDIIIEIVLPAVGDSRPQ
jgi:para-aminobenzoate synthetase